MEFVFNWSPTVELNLCVFRRKLVNKNDELKSHYGQNVNTLWWIAILTGTVPFSTNKKNPTV